MMNTEDFLVEIGTEELPPKALLTLSNAFGKALESALSKAELSYQQTKIFATPRRLAVIVTGLAIKQNDGNIQRRGPALNAAFDEAGTPTPAARGFAKSCGVSVDALTRTETSKGTWLTYHTNVTGKAATDLLPKIISTALSQLPIPKRMRWSDREDQFVRPVHWVVLLLGKQVIPATILGCQTSQLTWGHRFHCNQPLSIEHPQDYASILLDAKVMVDFNHRREVIKNQVTTKANAIQGHAVIEDDLLDEVTGLVEWPVAVLGHFDRKFLDIPAEALISAMQGHQKYFPIVDSAQQLLPSFITIANIDSHRIESVQLGNERVIRPRLEDAVFFWQQDKKQPLINRIEALKQVVFQKKLGSLGDKTHRVSQLCSDIASRLAIDPADAKRAATLAKCDLLTEMVGEFPELQGIMGRYYANHDNESNTVCEAIYEHYFPRFSGDTTPQSALGQALAIADKLDTIVGIFGINQAPTGDKDPFALRRAAVGILRIGIENQLPLDLMQCLTQAYQYYPASQLVADTPSTVWQFLMDRLRHYYLERGIKVEIFEAVLAVNPTVLYDFHKRVTAVNQFQQQPEAASLAAANKRIRNILKKTTQPIPSTIDHALLIEPAEQTLSTVLASLTQTVTTHINTGEYAAALAQLAQLKQPVDHFFDAIMVNVDDDVLRMNRLALLQGLEKVFLRIADFAKIS